MKLVIQRVSRAAVTADGTPAGEIDKGLMILCGIMEGDTLEDVRLLAEKTARLRIFTDEQDKLNLSVQDIGGGILVVSNFTLGGDCRRGNRPSFSRSAHPPLAVELYEAYVAMLREMGIPVETGRFGAHMEISMTADGPVTILMDSKEMKRPRRGE